MHPCRAADCDPACAGSPSGGRAPAYGRGMCPPSPSSSTAPTTRPPCGRDPACPCPFCSRSTVAGRAPSRTGRSARPRSSTPGRSCAAPCR
eukprot:306685-Prymnesium_polylepis.1